MFYTPFKQKETFIHVAKAIDKAVDTVLTEHGRIWNLDLQQLFIHINYIKICTYEMSADRDFIYDKEKNEMYAERDSILNQPINEILDSRNEDLTWVFVNNLKDLMDLIKPFPEFSELNKYIYEV